MEDLLGALLQGGQQQPEPEDADPEESPFAQILQGLLGGEVSQGSAPQAAPAPGQGEMDFGSLLQGILGGSGGPAGGAGQIPEDYGAQAGTGLGQGGLDMGGLLQGILGGAGGLPTGAGQAPPSGGGLGNVLGTIMGAGSPAMESDSFLAPIIADLAEKVGLPPQIAQTVVAFVLGKLMGQRLQPGIGTEMAVTRSGAAGPEATNMEDLLKTMGNGQRVTKTAIRDAGLAEELAAHTGLDRATAEASLQQVLNAFGGQLRTGQ